MADTLADRIVAAVYTRLAGIAVASGYNTDAGSNLFQDIASIDSEASYPALLVFDLEEDSEEYTSRRQLNRLRIEVCGIAKDTDCRPLIGDIKKAVLNATDPRLGGLADHLAYGGYSIERPEDGSRFSRVAVQVQVTYREAYGDPYTII